MYARGGLPVGIADRAERLPGVLAAAHVRSDSLRLTGSRDADGRPVDRLEPGWYVPVEVMAVDPAEAAPTVPAGPAREAVRGLRPGEVLLPASSAELRGLGPGAVVDLAGRAGMRVAAVIPDGVLGRDEIIVHGADADAVGLEPEGSLRVRYRDAPPGLHDDLVALAPEGTSVRVVVGTAARPARRASLVLGLPQVKQRFGEFSYRDDDADRAIHPDPDWVRANIVVREVPILGRIRCHREIFDDLVTALQAVRDLGLADTIDDNYGGCYHARRIGAGSSSLSHHSWGIAIDLNVDMSAPGFGPPPPPEVVDAFAAAGFRWGGLFLRPDNHHFEWVGAAAEQAPPPAGTGKSDLPAGD